MNSEGIFTNVCVCMLVHFLYYMLSNFGNIFEHDCNIPSLPLVDIVHFGITYCRQLHGFKMCLLRRSFRTLIRNASFPFPNDGVSQSIPLVAKHRSTFDFDTICNSPSPPQTDIVRFGLLCIVISLTVLKCVY